jgi:hypothetical protein
MNEITNIHIAPVDEAWIADWAAEGIAALERSLANHAAFEQYLLERDLESSDGDGAPDA